MSMDKAAFMQSLFKLMGKAVRILRTDGSMTEGIIKGILLDGAEMITMHGVIKVPYEEIRMISGFGTEVLLKEAATEKKEPKENVVVKTAAEKKAEREAEQDEERKKEVFRAFEEDIIRGRKEDFLKKLSNTDICEVAGFTAEEVKEMTQHAMARNLKWSVEPMQNAYRYRCILRGKSDPATLETLYLKTIRGIAKETSRSGALLELMRFYIKQGKNEEAILLYKRYPYIEKKKEHLHAYGTAIGYVHGESALYEFLSEHPEFEPGNFEKVFSFLRGGVPKAEKTDTQAEKTTASKMTEEEAFREIENDIIEGRKSALINKLSSSSFCEQAGISLTDAAKILKNTEKQGLVWNLEPAHQAHRYRTILREKIDSEKLVGLYEEAIEKSEKEKTKSGALLELMRIYWRQGNYSKIMEVNRKYLLVPKRKEHFGVLALTIGYMEGESALHRFLNAHPELETLHYENLFKELRRETTGAKESEEPANETVTEKNEDVTEAEILFSALEDDILAGRKSAVEEKLSNANFRKGVASLFPDVENARSRVQKKGISWKQELGTSIIRFKTILQNNVRLPKLITYLEQRLKSNTLTEKEKKSVFNELLFMYQHEKKYKEMLLLYKNYKDTKKNYHQMTAYAVAFGHVYGEKALRVYLNENPDLVNHSTNRRLFENLLEKLMAEDEDKELEKVKVTIPDEMIQDFSDSLPKETKAEEAVLESNGTEEDFASMFQKELAKIKEENMAEIETWTEETEVYDEGGPAEQDCLEFEDFLLVSEEEEDAEFEEILPVLTEEAVLPEAEAPKDKDAYFKEAVQSGSEEAYLAFYDYLYTTQDSDAPLLAAFMIYNSKIWTNAESLRAFETLCKENHLADVGETLATAFSEALCDTSPDAALLFLEKWNPVSAREPQRAIRSLSRIRQDADDAEIVFCMAMAYEETEAWRRLAEIYKERDTVCEGNILYSIAVTSHNMQDLFILQNFARNNHLTVLYTMANLLRMEWEPQNSITVRKAVHTLREMPEKKEEISPELARRIFRKLSDGAGRNTELMGEILFAGQILAIETETAETFLEICMPELSAHPKSLIAFMLSLYMRCPWKAALCEKVRQLLALSEDFPGKETALRLSENPGGLWQHGVNKSAATQLLAVASGLNVRKMHDMIFDAILDAEEDGTACAALGMDMVLSAFPEEGLLHEAMYYLLSADGKEEAAPQIYKALYRYLLLTKSEPKLFVHFAKRLYSGFLYLQRKKIAIEGAPETEEALQMFFDSINKDEALRDEFINFKHRTALMTTESACFDALLFAGMSGNWRPFMTGDTKISGRMFSEADLFIHEVGRYNFLRSLAFLIVSGEPWQHMTDFLSEAERMQTNAVAAVSYGGEDKRTALRLLRCTTLDKTSSEVLAGKLFATISPESFGLLMPVMRLLMLDSVLVETLREQKDEFLREATEMIMEQRETVPGQILGKTYRDFLRAMVNLLFDRGLYREASPVYGLLFTTDDEAARHNSENRYTNMTHAVLRQRQKFCDLVTREPETVDKFRETEEYAKLINIFAVHFASNRVKDIEKIEPLMTVIRKKLCAAVLYAAREDYEAFEKTGIEIWKENPAMGEVLFAYGNWKTREERWRKRFEPYLPKEQDEENKPFFISPKAHPACGKLQIIELLGLAGTPEDGREVHGISAAPIEEEIKVRRHIKANEFIEMPIAAYALLNSEEADEAALCREAFARYEKAPSFKTGVAVLRAKDFQDASEALLRLFCGSFSIHVFMAAENGEDFMEFVPNLFTCLAAMPKLSARDGEIFCDALERILITLESTQEYSFYFAKHVSHLKMLLSALSEIDEERKNAILLYFETAKVLAEIDPEGDGEKTLGILRHSKQAVAQHVKTYGGHTSEAISEALDFLIDDTEEMLLEQPLLSIRTDTDAVSCGNIFTGYVENSGTAPAEEAVLKITYANGETYGVQMRCLFGKYKAPFAFPIPGDAGTKTTATLLLTYTYEGRERRLRKVLEDIEILPREEYPLNTLPGMAISADEVEKYFVGRTEEIRSFENEFYTLETDAQGYVRRSARAPREVPVMVMNGPKRVGKSSLLHRVEKIVLELPDAWVPVHFDAQGAKSIREVFVNAFSLGFKKDGHAIAEDPAYKSIENKLPLEEELSMLELGRYYEAVRDTFAPGKKIIYLIDEFETVMSLCAPEKLLNMLQYAMKNLNHVISFLICGSDDLTNFMFEMENKTQFFQLAKTCAVGKMPRDEYMQLLEGFARRTGLVPDEEAKEALWLLARGQIYYTHLIFNQLTDLYRSRPVLCSRRDMRLFDVYYAFDRLHGGSEMFSGLSTMFDAYQSGEKEVMKTVAEYATVPGEGITLEFLKKWSGTENVEKAVTRLEARGFISLSGGKYMPSSEMYRVAFGKYATGTLYFRN